MGYPGWRWLFIVEGLPTLLMAYLCLKLVTDRPDQATWLTDAEKAHLRDRLQREAESRTETRHLSLWQTLANPKVLMFSVVYTGLATGIYGLSLWMPQLIKGMGVKDTFHIGLVMAIPYLIATVCMVLWSRHSDTTGRTRLPLCRRAGTRGERHGGERVHRVAATRDGGDDVRGHRHVLLAAGVLGDAHQLSGRCRCRRRHRVHQLRRQSRRLRRPVHGWAG